VQAAALQCSHTAIRSGAHSEEGRSGAATALQCNHGNAPSGTQWRSGDGAIVLSYIASPRPLNHFFFFFSPTLACVLRTLRGRCRNVTTSHSVRWTAGAGFRPQSQCACHASNIEACRPEVHEPPAMPAPCLHVPADGSRSSIVKPLIRLCRCAGRPTALSRRRLRTTMVIVKYVGPI
jgi:hypothetical protein